MDRQTAVRVAVDGGMAASFMALMADRYTGNAVHEWLGILLCLLMLVHGRLNAAWWKALPRVMLRRPVRTSITLLAAVFFVGAVVSAVPVSETVFAFAGMHGTLAARGLHIFFAHWAFLGAALHFGLYGTGMAVTMAWCLPVVPSSRACRSAAWILALYGVYVFVARDLLLPLTLQSSFTVWQEGGDGPIRFLLDYLAVFHAAAWGAHTMAASAGARRRSGHGLTGGRFS